ncbi:MAG: hypothetical protein HY303_01025 [Candidatus Wallbacteria bacterium]|nr:hypothetical protein [Candidatus Wallbacteria bacterium]
MVTSYTDSGLQRALGGSLARGVGRLRDESAIVEPGVLLRERAVGIGGLVDGCGAGQQVVVACAFEAIEDVSHVLGRPRDVIEHGIESGFAHRPQRRRVVSVGDDTPRLAGKLVGQRAPREDSHFGAVFDQHPDCVETEEPSAANDEYLHDGVLPRQRNSWRMMRVKSRSSVTGPFDPRSDQFRPLP